MHGKTDHISRKDNASREDMKVMEDDDQDQKLENGMLGREEFCKLFKEAFDQTDAK